MVQYMDNNSGFSQWFATQNAKKKPSRMSSFLWWIVLFLVSWWLVGVIMGPRNGTPENTDMAVTDVVDVSAVPVVAMDAALFSAQIRGLRVSDVKLNDYAVSASDDAPMNLLASDDGAFIEVGIRATGTTAPDPTTLWKNADGVATWRNSDGVEFTRNITTDGYVITITDTVNNKGTHDISVAPYARIVRSPDGKSSAGVYTGAVAYANDDLEHESWNNISRKARAYPTTRGGFIGFVDQYWETIVAPVGASQVLSVGASGDMYIADASVATTAISAGDMRDITTHVYVGPRERDALRAASVIIPGITRTMDYGWFGFLARPLAWILNGLNSVVGNYGLAIIILTILLRLLMWPLTRKSYTSMAKMQKMQPEMARIQKLYANDKSRMQMEMMRLYQTHKTSPMSGCLPMLIQIPIFFALYKALLVSVQMRSAHFLWISDLAAMDPYFVLPVLMGATMWWQQSLQSTKSATKNPNDPVAATTRAMRWMPIVFTIMFAWMPAGLILYWTTSNLFGILQMYIIRKRA